MRTVDVVIAVLWIVFWIYWLTASLGTKVSRRPSGGLIGFRIALAVLVFTLIRAGVFRHRVGDPLAGPWAEGIGLALFLAGLALAVWARLFIGRNWGTPMSQKVDPELVTSGPYHYVRHPIYSGIILAMIGTAVAVSLYWLAVVLFVGGYFVFSATVEERNMERLFPEQYQAYKRSTKMLIPFVF